MKSKYMTAILTLGALIGAASPTAFAQSTCPLPDKVTELSESVALTRTLKSKKTLLALRDVREDDGVKMVATLQLINAKNTFSPGEYAISPKGSIEGLCDHDECVELSMEIGGTTYAVVARAGKIILERTEGKLTGRLEGVTFLPGSLIQKPACKEVVYDLKFDVAILDKREPAAKAVPESQPSVAPESQPRRPRSRKGMVY